MQTALLVIDVQSVLFDPQPQPFEKDLVLQRINQLIHWARQHNKPVIFIQHEKPNSEIARGSQGWQLQSDLSIESSDHIVAKTTPDSFLNTQLQHILEQHHVTQLIVCGYASEFCVDTTVRKAASLGYSVTLVADAHTTHNKPHLSAEQIRAHHNQTLVNITSFQGSVTTVNTKELVSHL